VSESESIKVFIRNSAGEYLASHGEEWRFHPSRERAYQFDYIADDVPAELAHARRDIGVDWVAWPVDVNLIVETCGLCGNKMHTSNAHFDGSRSLCLWCRTPI
jgi:hypothetical protein